MYKEIKSHTDPNDPVLEGLLVERGENRCIIKSKDGKFIALIGSGLLDDMISKKYARMFYKWVPYRSVNGSMILVEEENSTTIKFYRYRLHFQSGVVWIWPPKEDSNNKTVEVTP